MTRALIRPGILYAWKGPSLLIVDMRGECSGAETLSGYYFREARFLKTLILQVNDQEPWLCESAAVAPDLLTFTLVYPELMRFGGGGTGQSDDDFSTDRDGIRHRAIAIGVSCKVTLRGVHVTLTAANHSVQPVECRIGWLVDADFADIQEAHSNNRELVADVEAEASGHTVAFRYRHARLPYATRVTVDGPGGWDITTAGAKTHLQLNPQQQVVLHLHVDASDGDASLNAEGLTAREERFQRWRHDLTQTLMPGSGAAESIVAANVRDFASFPLLEGAPDEWLTLQAGMPLYPALFGRDTLTAGWQAAYLDRGASLEDSLTRLSRLQSGRVFDWRDEEPGRIPYQVRRGPLAILDINPYAAYYADFASPLMFVIALAHLYSWTGDRTHLERHWDTARRILDWASSDGDKDRDGYLEYHTRSTKGTKNQGWRDSGDAIVYDDGSPVPPPIATCEIQGYWFAAQQVMAVMSAVMGARDDARAHWRSAMALKERFNRDWWMGDEGFVALALDPEKRPVRAITSSVGHCVASGIVSDGHLPRVVERLFEPDLFSGWGIRTLSTEHAAYNPMSYHLGSLWAVEQATIAFGLRRFGFDHEALELARGLFDLAAIYPEYRIPECVGGFARTDRATPGAYPRTNTPQLWNATAFPLLVHAMVGLQPVAALELLVVDPVLPAWLPEIILKDLRLAGARATIRCWRGEGGACHAEILEKTGTLRLITQPPPESLSAGLSDRFSALLDSLVPGGFRL
jgi:glycogen debranching enzyme